MHYAGYPVENMSVIMKTLIPSRVTRLLLCVRNTFRKLEDHNMTLNRRLLSYELLIGVLAAAVSAGCASAPKRERDIDPKAEPALKKMCDTLDNAKAFRFKVSATMDRPVDTGQLAQFRRASEITVVRPDRLYAKTDSDDGHWTSWYRNKTLTILDRDSNAYATETVPAGIGAMLDYMVDNYDLVIPMADLLVGKTYDSLIENVDYGEYLGLHTVGDTACHHLLFRQENLDWQVWIDAGKQPLPRKIVITYTQEEDQPQYVATMEDWDLAVSPANELFTFTPPAGAKSVSMSDLVAME